MNKEKPTGSKLDRFDENLLIDSQMMTDAEGKISIRRFENKSFGLGFIIHDEKIIDLSDTVDTSIESMSYSVLGGVDVIPRNYLILMGCLRCPRRPRHLGI